MKQTLLLVLLLISLPLLGQQTTPKEAFLEKWENSKNYLLKIVELMPEENFTFKPTARQMNFEEQLIHIQNNIEWLGTTYFSDETSVSADKNKREAAPISSKKVLKQNLNTSFDLLANRVRNTASEDLTETVNFFAGPKSKLQILNLLQDHVTHHRGQLIVYLNLNNIEPPRYVGW